MLVGPTRSVLFLPASNPRAIEKARTLACDVAVLDLEDAVAPEMKVQARAAAVTAVVAGGFAPQLAVRINGLDTEWGADDLAALSQTSVDLIVAPKVEDVETVRALAARLSPPAELWAMIETPAALLRLSEIAGAGAPLSGLMLGVNDLMLALGVGSCPDREPLKPWLAATVAAARANGLAVIDGVFNHFENLDGFAAECAQARLYGFDGKSLIHPNQVKPADAAFSPSPDELDRARAVVAAFATTDAQNQGAIRLDGAMVERLHLDAARRVLAHGGEIGC